MNIQNKLRKSYYRQLCTKAIPFTQQDLRQSSIVFAPHQDDETLGCGGTIIKKVRANAHVQIVFLTDGSSSHSSFLSSTTLMQMREEEAIRAAQSLGIMANNVSFLGFPDGNLAEDVDSATEKITDLLCTHQPESIFIPFRKEPPSDHYMTHQAVLGAVQNWQQPVTVYEYPVWYWFHWPWVNWQQKTSYETRIVLRTTLSARAGSCLVKELQKSIYVGDVLAQKRQALEQHRSQMFRPDAYPDWPILADVVGGGFLDCLLQEHEFFFQYQIS